MKMTSKNKDDLSQITDNDFFKIYKEIERKGFRKRDLFIIFILCVILALLLIFYM